MRATPLLAMLAAVALFAGCLEGAPRTNATMLGGDQSNIVAEEAAYFPSATGYFARPRGSEPLPGVVMVHEWWGLNDHIRDMARTLATDGHQVLAVDLFQGRVAATPEQAQSQVRDLDRDEAVRNMVAAATFLRERGAPTVSSLGWCFGGGQSLALAMSGEPLAATVLYYGPPVTNESQLQAIQWPVLGVFGDQDRSIPVEQVRAFEHAMDNLSIPNEVHVYAGVGHAFANPSGASYAPDATRDAWAKTLAFLGRNARV